ncbi:HPP family protein [Halobacterium litoreum]|uniref:HPP family protein n=1 Tax=Halobacterium litoreum TaxID=2039234 RepID=A0ABD5NDA4_9EURY|nr:HPP family protein [Halobacterium litoreum]UHH13830.1 HPP family protein [Halobacterium litoreum]
MSLSDAVPTALSDPWDALRAARRRLFEPVEERPPLGDALRTTTRVCGLLMGLAAVAWASGLPYIFPSLGPSAYALAVSPSSATSRPQRVFGGHLFGVVGGLLAYHLLAPGLAVTSLPTALSVDGARLAASATLSVGLTSAGMLTTDLRHAPACATTLIVGLGILPRVEEGGIILSAVLLLVAIDYALPGFGGVEDRPK